MSGASVFTLVAAFIVSLTIVWTITFGIGHFGNPDLSINHCIMLAQAGIVSVVLCAFMLAALFAERRQHAAALIESEARLQGALSHQAILMAELDHCVRNVLARISLIAMNTRQQNSSMDEFVRTLNGRIQAMAAAHSILSQSRWYGAGLTDLVRRQLAPYTTEANTTISGSDVMLPTAATQALAMVLHELVINATKHGALSRPGGRVSVHWDRDSYGDVGASLTIEWREFGGPPIVAPIQSGYGTNLIRELTPHEVGGKVDLVFVAEGVCCRIEIPLVEERRPSVDAWKVSHAAAGWA